MSRIAQAWLIAYDISCRRRWAVVHKYLCAHALWVQYSVFAGRFAPAQVERLAAELKLMIHPREDDVRIYRLPEFCHPRTIGQSLWPEEVFFNGLQPRPLQELTLSSMPLSHDLNILATPLSTVRILSG